MNYTRPDESDMFDVLAHLNRDEVDPAILELTSDKNNTQMIDIVEQMLQGKVFVRVDSERLITIVKEHSL